MAAIRDWIDRPGRFRSLGDGQIDFGQIFSKLAQYDYPGWAVMEWECCLKHPEAGAARAHLSFATTSSASQTAPSTISPAPRPTPKPTARFLGYSFQNSKFASAPGAEVKSEHHH